MTGRMSHWSQHVPARAWHALACPYCAQPLELTNGGLECSQRHHFDLARQGYVSLLGKDSRTDTADTADMVDARSGFLTTGHYRPIAEAVADVLATAEPALAVEIGAGTGYYLAAAVAGSPGTAAIALDSSKFAARQAARSASGVLSVVADAWDRLPLQDRTVGLVLSVFAPRNREEINRVLRPGGLLVVVTPEPGHLAELVGEFGMLTVDIGKADKLAETFGERFRVRQQQRVTFRARLDPAAVQQLVMMGPSAWHLDAATVAAAAEQQGEREVTVDVTVSVLAKPDLAPLGRIQARRNNTEA